MAEILKKGGESMTWWDAKIPFQAHNIKSAFLL